MRPRLLLPVLLLATGVLSQNACKQGEVSVNQMCLPLVGPGGSCLNTAQCQGTSTCINAKCTCSTTNAKVVFGYCIVPTQCGQTEVSVNGACAPYGTPGLNCLDSVQCLGSSICINQKCTCPAGAPIINGFCTGDGVGTGGCPTGQTAVNNQCASLASPGTQCSSPSQCLDKSTCSNGMCQCPGGTSVQTVQGNNYCLVPVSGCAAGQVRGANNQCTAPSLAGSPCTVNEQCIGGSICNSQMCSCPAGQSPMFGYCVPTGSSSSNGCPSGRVMVSGVCQLQTALGASCQSDQLCPTNSNCQSGSCRCSNGFFEQSGACVSGGSSNPCQNGQVWVGNQCVQKTPIGQFCFTAAQCGENAMCNNDKMCACNFGYQHIQGNCVRQSDTGNCQLGMVSVNGACRILASGGQQCISTLQCIDDTTCVNGVCACSIQNEQLAQPGYCIVPGTLQGCAFTQTNINGRCLTYSVIGEQCAGNQQCVGGSTCQNQRCSCPSGTTAMSGYCITDTSSGNSGSCAPNQVFVSGSCLNRVDLGSMCLVSQQCNQGTCTSNICTLGGNGGCPSGQVFVGGTCLNTAQPGGQCIVTQQCIQGGTCTSGICTGSSNGNCKSYQVSVNGACLDTVSIGMTCSATQQCIANAQCTASRCQCNSGLAFNGSGCTTNVMNCGPSMVSVNNQCMSLSPLNQFCTSTQQCMGFGVCSSSFCTCPYSFTEVNGVCRNTAGGDSGCPAGQVKSPSGQCLQMVNPGGFCQIPQQCIGSGSCQNSVCQASSSLSCPDTSKEVVFANGQPINCMVQLCPSDATCEVAQQNFVCCRARNGTGGNGQCSNPSFTPELLPNGQTKNCMQQACTNGRVCEYSRVAFSYVCCGPTSG